MYQRTVFESAKEVLDAVLSPNAVLHGITLVFDDGDPRFTGKGAEKFEMTGVSYVDLVTESFHRNGISVHFT